MIAGLLVAAVAVAHAAPADSEAPGPPEVGERLPAFGLLDLAGHRTRSTDIRQPVIVLNFWAFWCDTWTAELPQLRELAAQQRALNFRLIAVSVDGAVRAGCCHAGVLGVPKRPRCRHCGRAPALRSTEPGMAYSLLAVGL